jgi:hypothetical protein
MYDDIFLSMVIRPLFHSADVVFPCVLYADITSQSVALGSPNNVAVSCRRCSVWTRTNELSSFKIEQVSYFPFSHGLSLNTITNALTWPLINVKEQKKNTQCC